MKLSTLKKVKKNIINWRKYISDNLLKRKGNAYYLMKDGNSIEIELGTDDRYILNEIYVHEVYNPKGFELNPNDVVVDIGSQKGIFSLYAGRRAKLVYSFEPTFKYFLYLENHIFVNRLNDIIMPINMAVTKNTGFKDLYIHEENTGRNSFYDKSNKKERVQTISLKDVFNKFKIDRINFLKLDCEGSEFEILLNLNKKHLSKIDKIALEYHNLKRNQHLKLIKFLKKEYEVTLKKKSNKYGFIYAKRNKIISQRSGFKYD